MTATHRSWWRPVPGDVARRVRGRYAADRRRRLCRACRIEGRRPPGRDDRGKKPRSSPKASSRTSSSPRRKPAWPACINSLLERLGKVSRLFEQADCPIRPRDFFGISAGCGFLGVVATMVGHAPIPLYPLGALIGAVVAAGAGCCCGAAAVSRNSASNCPTLSN